jgi:hypothetical protein
MKKTLLLLALCAGTGTLMAQNKSLAPFNSTPGIILTQPLKFDSSLFKLPPTLSTENFFKQEPIDLNKLKLDKNAKLNTSLLIASDGYNMPVAKLEGNSKMPVVVLEGNSKMPIAGKTANNTVQVNP